SETAAGDDGAVQAGEDQPGDGLPAGAGADPRVHCTVLGVAGLRGDAQCAVDTVDPRPGHARPVVRAAGCDDGEHVDPVQPEPDPAGSGSGQDDGGHAVHFRCDVLLLPGRTGPL